VRHEEGEWSFGDGDVTLTLDDGRTVSFTSNGYDYSSTSTTVRPALDE
jgi:hypothetical protein